MKPPKVFEYLNIPGLLRIDLDDFKDHRGINFEGYNKELYKKIHPFFESVDFVVDSFSVSQCGVTRGFHGDKINYKLIQVLYGKIKLIVSDVRNNSNQTQTFYLEHYSPSQILVPAGCLNAHQCLSDYCVFSYKLSHGYVEPSEQITAKWNSDLIRANWDIRNPTLSDRDRG